MIENFMHIFPVSKEVVQFRFMGELFSMNYPVVHIAREDACIYPRSKFCVNHCLECCRGICETKEHDRRFEKTFVKVQDLEWCDLHGLVAAFLVLNNRG